MQKIEEDEDDDGVSVSPWSDEGDGQYDSRSDNPEVIQFI